MEFAKFVEWAFYGVVGGCSIMGVRVLSELNIKIAVIIEKVSSHEKRLDKHEEQIEILNKV